MPCLESGVFVPFRYHLLEIVVEITEDGKEVLGVIVLVVDVRIQTEVAHEDGWKTAEVLYFLQHFLDVDGGVGSGNSTMG